MTIPNDFQLGGSGKCLVVLRWHFPTGDDFGTIGGENICGMKLQTKKI